MGNASVGESFGPVAGFYDRLMRSIPYRMWVGYYLLLLSHQGVKVREILDVCCGTGSVTELLLAEGFVVEGFDLSEPMIMEARRKAKEKGLAIRYECQDAATFDMGRTYDAAFSFFDSLNYIVDPARLAMAMHRVAAHVEPGGSWIFDLNTAYAFEARLFDQRDLGKKSAVRYDWKGHWDAASRIITVDMTFWHEGQEFHETHRQRAYSDGEIREMLADAGFVDVRCFHSYTLERPRATSDRVHYACIRG
ncbi:MAG: class I SAM-dependent methyltransferase [Fimbriimonadaceae bacterium]